MNIWNLESESQLSACRRNVFAFSALVILILSVCSNSFNCSWQFDDAGVIVDNKAIHLNKMDWQSIKQTFYASPTKSGKIYRPVSCLTLGLNYYLGQLNVFGYHVVNTAIHILAALFLFLFVYHTLNLPLLKPKYGSTAYFIALLSAAFWAVNPLQTESVTYIVQRMTSLAGLFYIMAMYFYLKGRTSHMNLSGMSHYAAFVICSVFAFGSKENAAMLPFSLLFFDLFLIQGMKKEYLKRNFFIFAALIIIPVGLALIMRGPSVLSPKGIINVYETKRPFGPVEHLLTEPRVVLFYLSLLFYPIQQRLSIAHDITVSQSLVNPPTTIIAIIVILAILGLCIRYSRKWPLVCYCILFYFMNHFIEASFFGLELCFEHRNYVPSMLLFVPVTILLVKVIRYYSKKPAMRWMICIFLALLLVGFGNSTFLRNFDYETEGTLWADAIKKAPDLIRPHLNLGVFYFDHKDYDKALSEFSTAQSCHKSSNITDVPTTHYNIGLVYQRLGNLDKALEYYNKAASVYTTNADIYNNLGLLYYNMGQWEKAEHNFLEAIGCDNNAIQPYKNMTLVLLKQGKIKEALKYINLAGRQWSDDGGLLGAAGYAYRLDGKWDKAFLFLEKAVKIRPCDPKMHLYLSEIYFKQNKEAKANKEIQKFIQLEKDGDLKGYVIGTAKEEDIEVIKPYKKLVMLNLAQAYKSQGEYVMEKAQYLFGHNPI
ncbi:conserved membrane hypothetical protein [uncultured Desulfobacterium sp.]|uniref:Uncharacterized protein n=1 Tax=uncultured Desulfobacterium sp. TaxID=201089 RepID=A0A445MX46_9BACT|nr:conserved membrane hypothetical protein [uncultured Desulfobacterium sp.]